jgi:hypothetical protein
MALSWWQLCCKRSLRHIGQHPVIRIFTNLMGFCWWWLFSSLVLVRLMWTTRKLQKNKTKTLAELKFCRLGKYFYGTKRLCWDSVMQDNVLCQMYGTTGGISSWRLTIDQKMIVVHGSPCKPTPLMVILILMVVGFYQTRQSKEDSLSINHNSWILSICPIHNSNEIFSITRAIV